MPPNNSGLQPNILIRYGRLPGDNSGEIVAVLRYLVLFYYLVYRGQEYRAPLSSTGRCRSINRDERRLVMTGKREMRKKLLAERRALDRQRWLDASDIIQLKALEIPELVSAARVHCYVSMEHDREVCTLSLLERLAGERKELFMPYIEKGRMLSARYRPGHAFSVSTMGPPTPVPLILSEEERFDVVIVPLVGFDRSGGRIGYGKGWYDRFLDRLARQGVRPVTIGLAFSFQAVASVPCDSWDQRLDYVVTEYETLNCLNGAS